MAVPRIRLVFWLAVLVCLGIYPATFAQHAKRPITVEDLWKVQRLGKPAISPDGKWVAIEVTSYDMDKNDSQSQIWLLSTDGKTQKQLTTFQGKNSGPVWSPDGKWIAFVSKRIGPAAQIHLISPSGGEARQFSHLPMAPSGLKWGPDGKTIYCIGWTWPDTTDDESYKKKEKAHKDNKVQAYVIDDALFRYWDKWIADGKRPVVFAVDVASGKHKNVFAGLKLHLPVTSASADSFDISPDGKEICFTADSVKEIGTDYNLDLYTMSLEKPGEAKNITTDNRGNDFNPVYSPDNKSIAFLRQTTKFFYADRSRIMLLDRATSKSEELTKELDWSCASPHWLTNPGWLAFEIEYEGYHRLCGVDTKTKKIILWTNGREEPGEKVVGNIAVGSHTHPSSAGEKTVFLTSSFNSPIELWVEWSPRDGIPARELLDRIDTFNNSLRSHWHFGPVKNVTYKGADDEDVQMWIIHPPGFDPKKKWPLLMFVHGGPHNAITTDFHFRWNAHLLASKGYVVAIPNFHGSSGFGQKFTDSITGDMATKPFIDIMKATDYMEKTGYIDNKRMAAAGASYGGYMMAWMNGHTDRFKAMICHAGVYNWHSMMASDIVRSRQRSLGALPWGDLTKIDKQSPQRFAANFKTPTLIMHGEKDFRVPVTQGFEYYNTLRLKGVPTRLVYFPDENHWIMKPQNSRLWHREFFAWLEKYIGSGPAP